MQDTMPIIPVLDLKNQRVVHARQGQRASYQPICSTLSPSAELQDVISAYLALYPFHTFYLADLNALSGTGDHYALISQLLSTYPHCQFWVDSGYQAEPGLYQEYTNYLPVLGSESYTANNWHALAKFKQRYVLSLDFAGKQFLGANEIFQQAATWPHHVIMMNLTQVGSHAGPDFRTLQQYQQQYPQQYFIAAGGVRDIDDVMALQTIGIEQVLVASALHTGMIRAPELKALARSRRVRR